MKTILWILLCVVAVVVMFFIYVLIDFSKHVFGSIQGFMKGRGAVNKIDEDEDIRK